MLEQRRLDYLAAMGVVQWMPRQALPYAPAPRWLPEAKAKTAEILIKIPTFERQAPINARVALDETLKALVPKENISSVIHSPVTSIASVPEPVAAEIIVPKFHLHFVRSFLPVTWVCDNPADLPLLESFAFTVQKALVQESMFLAERMDFRWPFMATAPDSEQALPIALHALKMQWQFIAEQGSKGIISIGNDSQYWLSQAGAPVLFHASSLNEVMHNAQIKRQLWIALVQILKGLS